MADNVYERPDMSTSLADYIDAQLSLMLLPGHDADAHDRWQEKADALWRLLDWPQRAAASGAGNDVAWSLRVKTARRPKNRVDARHGKAVEGMTAAAVRGDGFGELHHARVLRDYVEPATAASLYRSIYERLGLADMARHFERVCEELGGDGAPHHATAEVLGPTRASLLAGFLLAHGVPFSAQPCPFGFWLFEVKDEYRTRLVAWSQGIRALSPLTPAEEAAVRDDEEDEEDES